MRVVLIIVAALILLNVFVSLWPENKRVAPHVYALQKDIRPNMVQLRTKKSFVDGEYEPSATQQGVSSLKSDVKRVSKEVNSAPTSIEPAPVCYKLGPFINKKNYHLAQQTLSARKINYNTLPSGAESSEVYRVYIGPFEDKFKVAAAMKLLRDKSIKDYFIRRNKSQQTEISLGVFGVESGANKALRAFSGTLDGVKKRTERITLPKNHWLLVYGLDLDSRRALSLVNWGEDGVLLGEYDCALNE